MFITKKNYENAIHEAKCEVAKEWERKMCDYEKRMWDDNERYRVREDFDRRFNALEKRILALEIETGLAKETPICPCVNAVTPPRF